jgi:DNA-binding NarL/FixJ family response regulator
MQTAITRTSGPGRVLLVDDHPAVRRVLRSLLEEVGGWQVVGEADSGEAAIPLVEQLAPDVVLMDWSTGWSGAWAGGSGWRTTRSSGPACRPGRSVMR